VADCGFPVTSGGAPATGSVADGGRPPPTTTNIKLFNYHFYYYFI
jgi:hypothetical protein